MAKEIKPLAELGRGGLVMVGEPAVPAKNFGELMSWVKAQPRQGQLRLVHARHASRT